jgi:endonuclease/exonuclease/phosphatase family metal-dependent hydrolase
MELPMLRHRRPLAALILLVPFLPAALAGCLGPAEPTAAAPENAAREYLFCFWNVENLFDDQYDHRQSKVDQEFDRWFAEDPAVRKLKYAHLSEALTRLNDGRGPDILAVAEVESTRAAELLRQALNERLTDPALHYQHVLMKDLSAGRHIAPAILTRLPVRGDKTRLHGHAQRILEGHVVVNDHDLVILATHWTSRITDKDGSHRARYADQIYGTFKAMYKTNPQVDLLVCGDFNDPPEAPSVTEHLHATGNRDAVLRARREPLLLDLMAGKDAQEFGTHSYSGRWYIFDQIVVSPGLLEPPGWSCDPASVQTVNSLHRPNDKKRRPWAFGTPHEKFARGYSDHFPVTVRLKVEGG